MTMDLTQEIVHIGVLAADMEALRQPVPFSSVRNPDGSRQHETPAEHTRRLVGTAIRHLLEQGLLAVTPDAEERMNQGIPIQRVPQ